MRPRGVPSVPFSLSLLALGYLRSSRCCTAQLSFVGPIRSAPGPPSMQSGGGPLWEASARLRPRQHLRDPLRRGIQLRVQSKELRGVAHRVHALQCSGATQGSRTTAAQSAVELLRPPSRGPTLHAYLFVTIVGWGKNTLLDAMLPALRSGKEPCPTWHLGGGADASDSTSLPGLFEGPNLESPTILESDALGSKRFWPTVRTSVMRTEDETVHHLFLNKNFPPNAWPGARTKLQEFCKAANRPLIIYAVVPQSPGTQYNAFHAVDLGICLASIQSRAVHPNLGKDSPVTASVAATFYNLYNFRGGRGEFLKSLTNDLTDNVIMVDWLACGAYERAPAALPKKMGELLARMGHARREGKLTRPSHSRTRRRRGNVEDGRVQAAGPVVVRHDRVKNGKEGGQVDQVALTAAQLEAECRALTKTPDVAQYLQEARLPIADVLESFEVGTRLVRKRLAEST